MNLKKDNKILSEEIKKLKEQIFELTHKQDNIINKNIYEEKGYIDQDKYYLRNKVKEPKYSLYFYTELNEEEDEYEKYLLLRIEIPGNITRLTANLPIPGQKNLMEL